MHSPWMKYDKSNILLLRLEHLMGVSATQTIQGLKFTPEIGFSRLQAEVYNYSHPYT